MIDVNLIRQPSIDLHGLHKVDDIYTLYYDETNNIRKLRIRSNGFLNEPNLGYFVLGGIGHQGAHRELSFDELKISLNLQLKNFKEIKLQMIGKGDFLELTTSRRLETFLKWVIDQDLWVHFYVVDPLYWSTVDIIDSILAESGEPSLFAIMNDLKNDLYVVLKCDVERTIKTFHDCSFPNVGVENRIFFIDELMFVLERKKDILPEFNYMMLKGVLEIGKKVEKLPFLENEDKGILIDGFGNFYFSRICLFKNSLHILDIEKEVQKYLKNIRFFDGEYELNNFNFKGSIESHGIQISDVMVGLLGKFFGFTRNIELRRLESLRSELSRQQRSNLKLMSNILDRSLRENEAFSQYTICSEDRARSARFLEVCG